MGISSSEGELRKFLRRVTLVFFASAACLLLLAVLNLVIHPGWEQFGALIASLTILTASLLAILYYRQGRTKPILWIAGCVLFFIGIINPLLISGMSLVIVLACLLLVLLVARDSLTVKQTGIVISAGLIILVLSFLIDHYGTSGRLVILQPTATILLTISLAFVDAYLALDGLSVNSLVARFIGTLALSGCFLVIFLGWVGANLVEQAVLASGELALQNAAIQVSKALDQELSHLKAYNGIVASLPAIGQLYTDPLLGDSISQANASLKGSQNAPYIGFREYLRGFILLDSSEKTILAEPSEISSIIETIPDLHLLDLKSKGGFLPSIYFAEDTNPYLLIISEVRSDDPQRQGYFVSVYNGYLLQELVQEMNNIAGTRSYAILVDENGFKLAQGLVTGVLPQESRLPGLPDSYPSKESSPIYFSDASTGVAMDYIGMPEELAQMPWTVYYVQEMKSFTKPIQVNIQKLAWVAGMSVLLIIVVAAAFTHFYINPVRKLTDMAEAIKQGDYAITTPRHRQDEIGKLTLAMNRLAVHLKNTFTSNEESNQKQSSEFERRTRQLQLAADVGRAAVTIHDQSILLASVAKLISERFNFYHVGIYLLDDSGEHAVLKAASSEGGKRMITLNHKLAVGYQGLVGFVAASGQAEIALNVGEETDYFNTPELPDTRSEIALPLMTSSDMLGVLDIQSTKTNAFTEDDFTAMQVLANLIAVALDNARLFAESKQAIEATRRAYDEISKNAWLERLGGKKVVMVKSQSRGTIENSDNGSASSQSGLPQSISIPIQIRDTIIGYIDTYKPLEQGYWDKYEEELLRVLADQIGNALESARLYESTKDLAARERLLGEVNARLQESLDVDSVIKLAVQIIRQALELKDITIVLDDDLFTLSGTP